MILIMTATVQPAKINQLCLRDTKTRLKQYCSAIKFYIRCKAFNKIVFCDNSNYPYTYETEQKLAEAENIYLEILKFRSDSDLIEKYGKGYGEGEILKYVINNSHLLKNENYFYKVTGRIKVKNVSILVKNNKETAVFNRNLYTYKSLDTRFWGIKKNDYIHFLMESYKAVNDEQGRYLEICYKKDIDKAKIPYKSFLLYPSIDGYSGTVGKKYNETKWYTKIVYDFLCYFNLFNTEEGFFIAYSMYNIVICKNKMIDVYYSYLVNNID